ncbi:MAG: DMT family transporter [Candidatus Calescibacterium sp.]|nr:DMT family transporter [Candidatus Calescibacterium sp.]
MRLKAELILFLITFIWAGTFVIIKPTLNFISPLLFVTIRFLIAALVLTLIYRAKLLQIPKATFKMGTILGIFLFVGFVVQTIGLKYTTATKSALITGTFVVFTPILQVFVERKPIKTGSILGVILVFVGLIFLSSSQSNLIELFVSIGSDFNIGDFLTLICAIFFAGYIVYLDIISDKTDFNHVVWIQIVVTLIGSFILMISFDFLEVEKIKIQLNDQVIFTILYTSILATIVTTFLQTKYQKYTTPTRAAIIFTSEPLLASILAYLILNETIGIFGLIGGALIILGVLTSELFDDLISNRGLKNEV